MSKKNIKIKKIKRAIKPTKSKPALKKVKKEKSAKSKPVKKAATKVQVKTTVKKKLTVKKVSKPIKKVVAKKTPAKAKLTKNKIKEKPLKIAKKAIPTKTKEKPKKLVSKGEKDLKKAKNSAAKVNPKTKEPKKKVKEEKVKKESLDLEKDFELDLLMDDIEPKLSGSKKRRRKKKKNKTDEEEPEILHDELVEQLLRSTKKPKSQPKVPKMLKTFVNPMASLTVAVKPNESKKASAPKKEPKGKFSEEYVIRTSANILYEFLTTPGGLSEWFADDVNIHDGVFTFFWDGSAQKARLLGFKEEEYVKMQWLDKPDGTYFEFRIQKDDITGDTSLIITDFADEASDLETSKRLWDTQVDKLLHIIGSY